jgi:hypothetical protein
MKKSDYSWKPITNEFEGWMIKDVASFDNATGH